MTHRSIRYFQLLLLLVQLLTLIDGSTVNHRKTKSTERKASQLTKKLRIAADRRDDAAPHQRDKPSQIDSKIETEFEREPKLQKIDEIMKHDKRCSVIGRSHDGAWYESDCGDTSAVGHHNYDKSEQHNSDSSKGGVFHFGFDPKQLLNDLPIPATSFSHDDKYDDDYDDDAPNESIKGSSDNSSMEGFDVIVHHGGTRAEGTLKRHKIVSPYQEQEENSEGKGKSGKSGKSGKGGKGIKYDDSKEKESNSGKGKEKSGKGKGEKGKGGKGKGGKGKKEKYEFEATTDRRTTAPQPYPQPSRQPFDRPVIVDPPPRKPVITFTLAPTPESQNDIGTPAPKNGPGTLTPTPERDNGPGSTAPTPDRQNDPGTQTPTVYPFPDNSTTPTATPTRRRTPSANAKLTTVPTTDLTSPPTLEPTESPSAAPSAVPTIAPTTKSPTKEPLSRAPATGPTTFPPTASPTTKFPTPTPTQGATRPPSIAPSASPTTKFPTPTPTQGATRPPSDAPSASPTTKFTTPTPTQGATRPPSIAPTTFVVSAAPVTDAPATGPASSRPTQVPERESPSGSPTVPKITSAPSIAPTVTATTATPTESLVDGIRVPVTRFEVDYKISETVNDSQFGEAEKVTLEYLRQFMEQQFAFNSLTDLIDFRGTLVAKDNAATIATYDVDLIFSTGSIGTPSSEEADLLVFAAFNQPFVPQLISQLQALSAQNPFSQTNAVTYNPVQRRRWLVELEMLPGPPGLSITLSTK